MLKVYKNFSINLYYDYVLILNNTIFFEVLVNIYKYKNLYQISVILNKVSKYFNSYLTSFNAGELV